MIHEQLMGGFGNQLFIYAFCENLVKHTGHKAILYFDSEDSRQLELSKFCIDQNIVIQPKTFLGGYDGSRMWYGLFRRLIEHTKKGLLQRSIIHLAYRFGIIVILEGYEDIDFKVLQRQRNIIVNGFFQSEKYFSNQAQQMRNTFSIDNVSVKELSEDFVNHCKEIRENDNSVCFHVRRGDYLNEKYRDKFLVCTEDYYRKAFKYINEHISNPRYYVFSDDIEWVKNNYSFIQSQEVEFVDNGGELAVLYDFLMMKECKHFVMSNSTLSWWVQYLAENEDKLVVAPSRWLNDKFGNRDIYQDTWHLIDSK